MFNAELISLSNGQSYDKIQIMEARKGDFELHNIPKPFGHMTIAFFHHGSLYLSHPWCVRTIHLDRFPRKGNGAKNFHFDRIVLDNDIIYTDGHYLDDDYYADLGIPDIFEDPGEVIDQVTFSCSEGIFITHDANVASIIIKGDRNKSGVIKSVNNSNYGKPKKAQEDTPA